MYAPESELREYERPPEGRFSANIVWIIDLGTQTNNRGMDPSRQVLFRFELVGPKTSDGKPMSVDKRLFFAPTGKALKQMCSHWLNRNVTEDDLRKPGLLQEMLKTPGKVKIIHKTSEKGKTYANIDQFTEIEREEWDRVPMPSVKPIMLGLHPEFFDKATYDTLPDWLKQAILKSKEGQAAVNGGGGRRAASEDRGRRDDNYGDRGRADDRRRDDQDDRHRDDRGRPQRDDRSYESDRGRGRGHQDDRRRYDQRMEDAQDSRNERSQRDTLADDRDYVNNMGSRDRGPAPDRPTRSEGSISRRAEEAAQGRGRRDDYDPDLDGRDAAF